MFKHVISSIIIGCTFWACESSPTTAQQTQPPKTGTGIPVDYSAGRAMNAILGRGINLGNAWESSGNECHSDDCWENPIRDTDFAIIKAAGFNSVRIPVQWSQDADPITHNVNPIRLQGVMEDISLAIANGLAVVVNFHHYFQINCYAGGYSDRGCQYNAEKFEAELAHFLGMWTHVATALNVFPDNMLVFEILNEPTLTSTERLNRIMNEAYKVIRAVAPGKTIMFESNLYAKFYAIEKLNLPQDGNIIFSGHYYEPYQYSHQGHSDQYSCIGDAAQKNTAKSDLRYYVGLAYSYYPDVNGIDQVPLNMGEFGISGGDADVKCGATHPSNEGKAEWAKMTAKAAIDYGISFHYWGFGATGGFDAFNIYTDTWYPGFPEALIF